MQTCHFASKETRTVSNDERWRADGGNHSFPFRKATLLIGQGPAVLCQTLSGLREPGAWEGNLLHMRLSSNYGAHFLAMGSAA